MAGPTNIAGFNCCSGTESGGGGTGSIPGCLCPTTPGTLAMTVCDPTLDFGAFQRCTIQWGPAPAAFAGFNDPGYWSTASLSDDIGDSFYYYLTCSGDQWQLHQAQYSPASFTTLLYSWFTQNTDPSGHNYCSGVAVLLDCGGPYSGADSGTAVLITGGSATATGTYVLTTGGRCLDVC